MQNIEMVRIVNKHIRVFRDENNALWFNAHDVYTEFGLGDPKYLSPNYYIAEYDKKNVVMTADGKKQKVLYVNEHGLCALLLRSLETSNALAKLIAAACEQRNDGENL
jgi:prophage antirepressor-like protein